MTTAPLPRAAQARLLVPFVVVTLIWGSTWLVIRGQFGAVPVAWSVTYRFALAGMAMFAVVLATRAPLRIGRSGQLVAIAIGVSQFMLNYNLVYQAERHVTSGLVATVFALLIVPNAVLGRIFLGQDLSRRFLVGSALALAGIALLFVHELRANPASAGSIAIGIVLTGGAVLAASFGNILQAAPVGARLPVPVLLAWSMAWGTLANAAVALATSGPPRFSFAPGYVAGLLYLGLAASALAFFLYYRLIRAMGAARAAYSNVLIPILAMTLSTLFEAYLWSVMAVAGAALVLAGLVIAIRARSPAR